MNVKFFKLIILTSLLIFSKADNTFSQMFWNQAGSFAGSSASYLAIRNTATNNITGSFTLEAWVNPNIFNGFSKGVICKGGAFGTSKIYGMRLQSTGRFDVYTNGSLRLTSNNSCPLNHWTHIAATYNASNNTFSLYFNGTLDNSMVIAGAAPGSNTDSLFVGVASSATPFSGMLDEVRVWNRALSIIDINRNMRVSLGTNTGYYYNGLIMSLTFQKETSGGIRFSMLDWSGTGNFANNHGVTAVDLSDVPSKTIAENLCLDFSFGNDYMSAPDHPNLSPTSGITMEAWIYPRSNLDRPIIHKGPASGGVSTNYSLNIINKKLAAKINGGTYDSHDTIPINRWSHVAFTYRFDGLFSYNNFYVNGKRVSGDFSFSRNNITDGNDSFYIGGTGFLTSFNGYIDEVRISQYAKSQADIIDSLYTPLEYGFPYTNTASYNLDGYAWCNTLAAPVLNFRNSPVFVNPSIYSGYKVSPLVKNTDLSFDFQQGFYIKTAEHRIPETGVSGSMKQDTINITSGETVNDINVYVALNHSKTDQLQIDLTAPDGTTVRLMDQNSLINSGQHVITVFDDQASAPLLNNTYVSFTPSIRPLNNLNAALNGKSITGDWKISVTDLSGVDTGRFYSWGIQINNKNFLYEVLTFKGLIQGFYNPVTNTINRDTVRSFLRNANTPYAVVDQSITYLQNDGSGVFSYFGFNLKKGNYYFLQVKHRNSIETWTKALINFDLFTSQGNYDLTSDSTQAFGNNLVQVDNTPLKFAVYNGDVNQDGQIEAADLSLIDNDAFNFSIGYVNTDLTGDNVVDASDALIAENNAANFVSKITP